MRLRSLSWNGIGLAKDTVTQVLLGVLILTAALIGSFLRGYVKWPKKPARSTRGPPEDKAQKQWNEKAAKIHVFPTATPPPVAIPAPDFIVPAQLDDFLEFDPEKDYAQVLAEARRHLESSRGGAQIDSKEQQETSWLPTSQQSAVYRQLESVFAEEEATSVIKTATSKSTRLWKLLLFWHRPKKQQQEETFSSIFGTPQHSSFRPPRNVNKVGSKSKAARRGNSGPIYTDGLPSQPSNRPRKPSSGPLGTTFLSSSSKELPESPYQPLRRPFNPSSIALSPPLYSV